jgi:hypothetical protein
MRQRFMQVLGSEGDDEVMTDVVRRFWTRAKPLTLPRTPAPLESRPAAQVVDLATWVRSQRSCREGR